MSPLALLEYLKKLLKRTSRNSLAREETCNVYHCYEIIKKPCGSEKDAVHFCSRECNGSARGLVTVQIVLKYF